MSRNMHTVVEPLTGNFATTSFWNMALKQTPLLDQSIIIKSRIHPQDPSSAEEAKGR
jgi:hypothetical protein